MEKGIDLRLGRRVKVTLGLLGLVLLVVIIYLINPSGTATLDPRARLLGYAFYSIPSGSMAPTLIPGDIVLTATFAYASDLPRRDELIVYIPPVTETAFVGRVVAISGDTVSVTGPEVTLNGQQLEEEFVLSSNRECHRGDVEGLVVPAGKLFILGDNRCNSNDSRYFGFVDTEMVIGRITSIVASAEADRARDF